MYGLPTGRTLPHNIHCSSPNMGHTYRLYLINFVFDMDRAIHQYATFGVEYFEYVGQDLWSIPNSIQFCEHHFYGPPGPLVPEELIRTSKRLHFGQRTANFDELEMLTLAWALGVGHRRVNGWTPRTEDILGYKLACRQDLYCPEIGLPVNAEERTFEEWYFPRMLERPRLYLEE
jgi:hypothetical protein